MVATALTAVVTALAPAAVQAAPSPGQVQSQVSITPLPASVFTSAVSKVEGFVLAGILGVSAETQNGTIRRRGAGDGDRSRQRQAEGQGAQAERAPARPRPRARAGGRAHDR